MRLFFYGTLVDSDIFALVVGRPLASAAPAAARLSGYVRRRAADEGFPVIVAQPDGMVDGIVVEGLTEAEIARIRFYDGSDFRPEVLPVALAAGERVDAVVAIPTGTLTATDRPWSVELWRATDKAQALALADSYLALYGRTALAEAEARWIELKDQAARRFAEARAERHFAARWAARGRR
jgi:hypothetical protein